MDALETALPTPVVSSDQKIRAYFETLYAAWGRQHWWPAESPFEVIAGAYLTQNTSWNNVERAMARLREAKALSAAGIRRTPVRKLEQLVRSAGYFRQKALRLKIFVQFLDRRYGGSLARMFAQPTAKLRGELLALNGVGPETADSILLYAGGHTVFVVDAYTRRILERHELIGARATYEEIRELFEHTLGPIAGELMQNGLEGTQFFDGPRGTSHSPSRMSRKPLPVAAQVFNEMHGLIVGVGKNYCKKSQPDCEQCPLKKFLPEAK